MNKVIILIAESLKLPEPEKPRVRIRGIYATALTKLFYDNGFEIIQPSEKISKRFNLKPEMKSPYVDIEDTEDKQGVKIESHPRLTNRVKEILFNNLHDVIIFQSELQLHSIWKGIVFRAAPQGGWIVRLTPEKEGILSLKEIKIGPINVEDVILVQIRDFSNGYPVLTTSLTIPGENIVLMLHDTRVHVSHKIKGEKRKELFTLGNEIKPKEYGLIMRTSAIAATREELIEEIEMLKKQADELLKKAERAPALSMVREGYDILTVYFPGKAKQKLDEIRSQVFPTVKYHHYMKSFLSQDGITSLIDFVEGYILSKYELDRDKVSDDLLQYLVEEKFPKEGNIVSIQHKKLTGRTVILGPATVVEVEKDTLTWYLFRRFKPGGMYDGLFVPKEPGDFGFTIVKWMSNSLITVYFNVHGELKGMYLNINTPIEVIPQQGFTYWDLEIDVVKRPEEEPVIIDREKIDEFIRRGWISQRYGEAIKRYAETLCKWIKDNEKKILNKCQKLMQKIKAP